VSDKDTKGSKTKGLLENCTASKRIASHATPYNQSYTEDTK